MSVYVFFLIGQNPTLFSASDWSEPWQRCMMSRLRVFLLFQLSTTRLNSTVGVEQNIGMSVNTAVATVMYFKHLVM